MSFNAGEVGINTGRAIAPAGNTPESDRVLTPLALGRRCVQALRESGELHGHLLEPCAGAKLRGGFYHALIEERQSADPLDDSELPGPSRVSFCEIDEGLDFLDWDEPVRWIICNPPWSRTRFLSFVEHAFSLAPNVAFLCPAERAWRNSVKERARRSGHRRRAMWDVEWPEVWSRPRDEGGNGIVKPGFGLALVWWQRGYAGPIEQGELPEMQVLGGNGDGLRR